MSRVHTVNLDALREMVATAMESGDNIPAGPVRGLIEDYENLSRRCDGYELQRKIIAGVVGCRSIMHAKDAMKDGRMRRLGAKAEESVVSTPTD